MNTVTTIAPTLSPASGVRYPDNLPLVLDEQAHARIVSSLGGMDFLNMPLREIATLGVEATRSLNKTLDGFLARIEKNESPQLFTLIDRLSEAVDAEDLPGVATKILDAQPSLMQKIVGAFSKKRLKKAVDQAYEEAARIASGKSRSLSDKIKKMEAEFEQALDSLHAEIRAQEEQKQHYRKAFYAFAETSVFLTSLVDMARSTVESLRQQGVSPQDLADAEDKLQALTSRALAVEGTLSRLPSEELVIRQIQNAGVATWQEVSTTASERFISIKETLLAIHGTLAVRNVQRLAQQGAELDKNLGAVRTALMKEVLSVASNAPGDNRLAQANQLRGIVAETQALVSTVERAKKANQEKFEQARQIYALARKEMYDLGDNIPDPPRVS